MTVAAQEAPAAPASPPRPLWRRLVMWGLIIVIGGAAANLLGWDIRGWFSSLWDTITTISAASLVAAICLMIVQTTATAFAWYSILHFAYAERTKWRDILAGYAVSVALNGILPANIGTLMFLIMLTSLLAISFVAVLGAYAVEKIFFTCSGTFVYLYLFLTVGGSFDISFDWVHQNPVATIVVFGGGALMLVLLARRFWPRVLSWWEKAKEGGAILARPRRFFGRVFLPSFIGWCAMLTTIGVFLNAYGIPVSFDTLMHVAGGNSLANVTSFTPGGVGVTQAWNVASLKGVASSHDATAYSVAQQLVGTAWNIVYALILMIWAWGWGGGKRLVSDSYAEAKRRQAEEQQKRRAKKAAAAAEKQVAS
ncbi:MAG TPA: lysylphosphatidylglycerol synthase transmembrane domain-containing protein [Gaiellaceae bacterium]|nr:lysylphosphatidylglycerol synthase transmembrane domain-containing protein [Gaiellaceae bacterium]